MKKLTPRKAGQVDRRLRAARARAALVEKYVADFGGPEAVGAIDAELLDDLAAIRTSIRKLQADKDAGQPVDEESLKGLRWQTIQLRGALRSGRNLSDVPRAVVLHVSMTQIREAEEREKRFLAEREAEEAEATKLLAAPVPEPATISDDVPSRTTHDPETTLQ